MATLLILGENKANKEVKDFLKGKEAH